MSWTGETVKNTCIKQRRKRVRQATLFDRYQPLPTHTLSFYYSNPRLNRQRHKGGLYYTIEEWLGEVVMSLYVCQNLRACAPSSRLQSVLPMQGKLQRSIQSTMTSLHLIILENFVVLLMRNVLDEDVIYQKTGIRNKSTQFIKKIGYKKPVLSKNRSI